MTRNDNAQDRATIKKMIENWSRAIEARDVPRIVEAYTDDTVLFDAIPPFRTVGRDAIAALWSQCLPYFPDKFKSEHKDLAVEVDGDVAFVHALHHFVPEEVGHPCGSTWMRVTACYKRIDGAWTVAHEHVSVPFNPMSGRAVFAEGDALKETDSPAGPPPVSPHLVCSDAAAAIDFYKKAFAAEETFRLPDPSGKIMHAALNLNGGVVMLVDEYPEMGHASPTTLKGTSVSMHLVVDDVDAATEKAIAAGAKVILPVDDMFWGDRYGVIEDPFGHRWSIATTKKVLSNEEIAAAFAKTSAEQPGCV